MKSKYHSFTSLLAIVLVSSASFGQIKQQEIPKIDILNGSFSTNIEKKQLKKDAVVKNLNLWFDLNNNFSFKQVSEKTDELKITHTDFEQYFKGFLIEGQQLMLHSRNGVVKNINGQARQFSDINTEINIATNQAKQIAKDYLKVNKLINEYPIETVIINLSDETAKLAHKVRIDSASPFTMCNVYIDTQTGEVLNKIDLINHVDVTGTGQTLYSGNKTITCDSNSGSYRLIDNARKIITYNATEAIGVDQNSKLTPVTVYVNSSTTWGGSEGSPEIDVHWGMEMTHDFYKNVFNRTGYDGNGSPIRQYVDPKNLYSSFGGINNSMAMPTPYDFIEYGMGDGIDYKPLVDLSTIGHEFTHKIIEYNGKGGLNYQGETGALNESFADIMGTCVDFYAGTNPNWIIGEEFTINAPFLSRSMSNPNDGKQPDTYKGQFWVNTLLQSDNGGVHTNSGVQNYWFYLLCDGGAGTNDIGNNYTVEGIGIEQGREIVYRSLTNYLTKTAKYIDAYYGSLLAAEDLYGYPSPQYTAVMNAWYAVGIGKDPNNFCAGTTNLTAASGTLTDGSSSLDYGNNADCKWVISPTGATKITLNFSSFDTESNADTVTVYDGPDENSPVLATLSGSTLPGTLHTTPGIGTMCVKFATNLDVTKTGWSANYTSTNLGIEDSMMSQSLTIYPNPATNRINVSYINPSDSMKEIIVYDLTGKKVYSLEEIDAQEISVDVARLEKGMYLLEITSQANNKGVKKLMIN